MAKEIILYDVISKYSAGDIVQKMIDAGDSEDLLIRMDTGGGYTASGFSVISKMKERKGKTSICVDGDACSMGAIMLMFADDVTCHDASRIMFHKAAYPEWYEPTDQEKEQLAQINDLFSKKMNKCVMGKPGADKFIAKVFDESQRNDVWLTPKDAMKLGIVSEVKKLDPRAEQLRSELIMQVSAIVEKKAVEPINNNNNKVKMTKEELKAQHPELYSAILAEGKELGTKDEKVRTEAFLAYLEADKDLVVASIKEGKAFDNAVMAELNVKLVSATRIAALSADSAKATGTKAVEKIELTAEEKEVMAFGAELLNKFKPKV